MESFIERLPGKLQARVLRTIDLLAEHGTGLPASLAKKVTGEQFWELRVQHGRSGVRVFYFAETGRRMVLLHGFAKKTQKTPQRELATARQRLADYRRRSPERP